MGMKNLCCCHDRRLFCVLLQLLLAGGAVVVKGKGYLPPPKYDGFFYKKSGTQGIIRPDGIFIDAFLDPLCPDSRDSWAPLQKAIHHYAQLGRLSLIVHPFPLPYHDNAFVACRALHITDRLKSSATYPLLEHFFKHQERFYNEPTSNMSRPSIVEEVARFAAGIVGNTSLPALRSGFLDRNTHLATRISFKYGCSRGVKGTPFFFVNGFLVSESDSPMDYKKWRSIIDPLVGKQS